MPVLRALMSSPFLSPAGLSLGKHHVEVQRLRSLYWRLKIWKQIKINAFRERRGKFAVHPIAWMAPLATVALGLYVVALWKAPDILTLELSAASPEARLTAAHNARLLVISVVSALVVGAGLLYTARNYRLAHRGQVTDRFAKSLERLGSNELYIRIGGIRALGHVMQDSPDHYLDCVEVLAAFIRARAPRAGDFNDTAPSIYPHRQLPNEPEADVQAAFTALAHRPKKHQSDRHLLDFHDLHLRAVNLADAQLDDADFRGADLQECNLSGASARGALFDGANLRSAELSQVRLGRASLAQARLAKSRMSEAELVNSHLVEANMEDANLYQANLHSANLRGADLRRTQLVGANFSYANLSRANLSFARLTGAQLVSAQLSSASLNHATLIGADLNGANLQSARMQNAVISHADEADENPPHPED
ncbi:Uncharacterized protein YjbI, contains pentapeptide repeats [Micromonospora auratinigra]|uniref:Uncharacterized protein YjbI, contains pentapeptide repeats n=1 Tax=Micromonospora auratinigra TaxID=261654 RepID=A0A1A8ZNC8_9ACTN|nr:Uncharacterized protein YjbI, contains pentapeptide repeats [Micromonospora auratinigra]